LSAKSNATFSLKTNDAGAAGPGNITTQTGVGTYHYPAAGQPRPHAVTSITGTFNGITNPGFSYVANGNMTDRASSSANVAWSSYNYPTSISATDATGSEEVQFSYGPDRQRWKQIYTSPTPTETTYYVGGLLEVVFVNNTTNYRHYIYAGAEPIAVYGRTAAGVNTMSYMLEDHQGGVSSIASKSGAADVNESFSAFGTRRSPTTWSGAPSTADLNTIAGLSRQGYTFQTALGQSMGLNHMNGRVQDAILGRFLSPDPHIPNPGNAQSYNRYSYVNNNPVTNNDPTGFSSCVFSRRQVAGIGGGMASCTGSPEVGGADSGFISFGAPIYDGTFVLDIQGNSGTNGNSAPSSNPIDDFNKWALGSFDPSLLVPSQSEDPETNPPTNPPSLAQSQDSTQSQSSGNGSSVVWNDPNDPTAGVIAYRTRTGSSGSYSYVDNYVGFVSTYSINVGPYASALAGGLWPKSWSPATNFRPPLLGSSNPLTSVPRAFGVPGADSVFARTGAAGIGLATVGIGFYDFTIEFEGLFYALPDVSVPPPSFPIFPY